MKKKKPKKDQITKLFLVKLKEQQEKISNCRDELESLRNDIDAQMDSLLNGSDALQETIDILSQYV